MYRQIIVPTNFKMAATDLIPTHLLKDSAEIVSGVGNDRSRLSKVVDFGTNRKRVFNFLLVINSNVGPILPRFRDIAGFLLKTTSPPLFNPNFGVFPLD